MEKNQEKEKEHNEESEWIKREGERAKETEQQECEDIELKEVDFHWRNCINWNPQDLTSYLISGWIP